MVNPPDAGWYDPKVIVAVYAAIVGTASLGWNIIKEVRDNKGVLKVEVSILTFLMGTTGSMSTFPILKIRVTNKGKSKRQIYQPNIVLQEKVMGTKNFSYYMPFENLLREPKKYPYSLESGEVFEDIIRVDELYNQLFKNLKKTKKIKISLLDTYGKRYTSNSIKIKDIEDLIKTVDEVEKERKINKYL